MTLTAPGSFQALQFLDTAQGPGAGTNFNATLNFADGSHTVLSVANEPDWTFNGNNALLNTGLANTGGYYGGTLNLFEHDFTLTAADQAKTLNSVTFNTTSSTGAGLAFFAMSGQVVAAQQPQNYSSSIAVTANSTIDIQTTPNASAGGLSINGSTLTLTGMSGANFSVGATTLTASPTFVPAAGTTLTLGSVSDGGTNRTVTMSGAGTLAIAGSATYNGGTTVSSGAYVITPTGSLNSGATFLVNGPTAVANLNGVFTHTTAGGDVLIQNGGTINWSGTGTIGGSNVNGILIGNGSAGTFNMTGGSLAVNFANNNGFGIGWQSGGAGVLNLSGGTITTSNADVFLVGFGATNALGSVNVSGSGILNIGGGGGQIFIGGGTNGSGQAGTGTLTVGSGGIINVAGPGAFPNEKLYLAGFGGSGTINLNAGGLLSTARPIGAGGPSVVNFNGGTLQATTSDGAFLQTGNGTFIKAGGAIIDSLANSITLGQPVLTDPGLGSTPDGGLTKIGSGVLTLAATNTYTGGTFINGGTLSISAESNLGASGTAVSFSGGTLRTTAMVNSSRPITLNVGGGTVNTGGVNSTFTGPIAGGGTLTKTGSGSLALYGANGSSGGTTVNQGVLSVGALNALGSGPVTLSGGTLQLATQSAALQHPLSLSGYNQDVVWAIGESTPAAGTTTNVVTWDWYEHGAGTGTQGLPANSGGSPRTFTSTFSPTIQFQYAPYTSNNALLLTSTGANGTVTLAAPGKFQSLQYLTSSQGNTTWNAMLNFADGSQTMLATVTDPDWTNSGQNAISNIGLVQNNNSGYYAGNLFMYEHDFALSLADQGKTLNSVTLTAISAQSAGLALFGLSGQTATTTTQSYSNSVNVTADSTIDLEAYPFASLGVLAIGGNRLSVTGLAGGSLTVGTTTLSGSPTFDPAASTTLVLGALADGGTPRTITKINSGTLALGTPASSLVNGTQVNVTGGALALNQTGALGTLAAVDVATGSTVNLAANQTIGALSNSGNVVLNGNTLTVGSSNNLSSSFSGIISDGSALRARQSRNRHARAPRDQLPQRRHDRAAGNPIGGSARRGNIAWHGAGHVERRHVAAGRPICGDSTDRGFERLHARHHLGQRRIGQRRRRHYDCILRLGLV